MGGCTPFLHWWRSEDLLPTLHVASAWLSRYKKLLGAMPKTHHHFYISPSHGSETKQVHFLVLCPWEETDSAQSEARKNSAIDVVVSIYVLVSPHPPSPVADPEGGPWGPWTTPPPLWDQPDPFLDHSPWTSEGFHSSFYFHSSHFRAISLEIVYSWLFDLEKSLQLAAS